MDPSSVEVRVFVQHLAQWNGAFSRGEVAEARAAIEAIRLRGRWLCADPQFCTLLRRHEASLDPEAALRSVCAFLAAVTSTHTQTRNRSEG